MARRSMRTEIIEAGLEQFHSLGFNAAGVKGITDAAGVPKGSFYNHFDSKEALAVVALQEYGAGRRLAELRDPAVDPLTRLRAHFEFLRDETIGYGITRGCMIGNFGAEIADHNDTIRTAVREALADWADAIEATLADAQRSGEVRADLNPATTARFLLSAWEGTLIEARTDRSTEAFDVFFAMTFDTLLR
ncbi:TetR family transcriptional regulator C-terminal domain-containing protein [Micromonospora sp. NPDC050397]|uniref:TetR/AcrR family transcriptional regulator n=1 Tax=Micromonospora sp. NPDC050397 TaxID=3364279 RepID=UPI00384CA6D2